MNYSTNCGLDLIYWQHLSKWRRQSKDVSAKLSIKVSSLILCELDKTYLKTYQREYNFNIYFKVKFS